jgi:hypothetical protein
MVELEIELAHFDLLKKYNLNLVSVNKRSDVIFFKSFVLDGSTGHSI